MKIFDILFLHPVISIFLPGTDYHAGFAVCQFVAEAQHVALEKFIIFFHAGADNGVCRLGGGSSGIGDELDQFQGIRFAGFGGLFAVDQTSGIVADMFFPVPAEAPRRGPCRRWESGRRS